MPAKQPFVSIIIVNFNGKQLLGQCLGALLNIDYPKNNLEIIVVDNDSKDGSVEFIKAGYKKTKVIENKVNNYCQACNLGILSAKGEYVVLLNNDVVVQEKWLLGLVEAVKNDNSAGAVTSKLLKEDGSIQNAGLIELPNFYLDERGSGKRSEEFNSLAEVDAVSGASVLYSRAALDQAGLLDEDFVIFGEDVDLSFRLKSKGWKLLYAPSSVAYHKMHGSCDEPFARQAIEKNRLLFIAKHHPEKLANSLIGNKYFISVKENEKERGRFFDLLPFIFLKLIKEHNPLKAGETIKEVLAELKKVINYENIELQGEVKIFFDKMVKAEEKLDCYIMQEENYKIQIREKENVVLEKDKIIFEKERHIADLSSQLNAIRNELKTSLDHGLLKDNALLEKERHIADLSSQLNAIRNELKTSLDHGLLKDNALLEKERYIADLSQQLNNFQNELEVLKEQNLNLAEKLKTSLDHGLLKDNALLEKERHIGEISQQLELSMNRLNEAQNELSGIYNSTCFKFILNPIWRSIWCFRIISRRLINKFINFIWSAVSLSLCPVILLQALCFIIEYIAEKLFGRLSLYFKIEREVVSFDKLTVSIVIPDWNGIELLKKCLSSIYEADSFKEGDYEVLVVDDASEYKIAQCIKDDFPKARVIRNNYNRGFGRSCNRGVKEAKGELIVLLNNDIMVSKDFLAPLLAHFKDPQVFAVAPKLYYWDKKTFNYGMHMGEFKDGYLTLWNESETGNGDRVSRASPTIFAIGGAACFRKKDFLWLGGFDDLYRPNCWEDIDISYRAQKRGLKVLYEPKSLVFHKSASTLNYVRHKEIKNELLFMWKNLTDVRMLLSHLNLLPRFLYYGRYSSRITFLTGYFWAFRYFVPALIRKFREARYYKVSDKKILNKCKLYYENFKRNNYNHFDRKTILMVTPFMIYPLNCGGKLRIYNLCKRLAGRYNLILLSLIHNEREEEYANPLKEIFKEVYLIHTKTASKEPLFPRRYKYSFSSFFIEKLNEIIERLPIDLIHIESNELLYLAKYVKEIPIVYTEHDISILSYRKSYYKNEGNSPLSGFIDYLKIVRHHNSVYGRIDKVIALSKEDIKVIKAFSPRSDCSLIPTGVDLEHFAFRQKFGSNKSLVFVGHYQHYPNEEAAVYFCRSVFPIIKKLVPEATLKLVGSSPSEKIIGLARIDGVEVIGSVPDVFPYLQEAAVFVCPFQSSAGIKGKVLEAMSTGTPVVSTTRGSYGIDAVNESNIFIADNPGDFAKTVIKLFNDEELYKRIAFNARKLVEDKYDWNKIIRRLDSVYTKITGDEFSGAGYEKRNDGIKGIVCAEAEPVRKESLNNNNISVERIIEKVRGIVDLSLEIFSKDKESENDLGPQELHIELTHSCNSRCIMCDIWDYYQRNNKTAKDEITLKEIRSLIDNSKRLKRLKTVVLSGGEPFLRPDFSDICVSIKSILPQASLGILTNGLNTEAIVSGVKGILEKTKAGSLWIGSSLDGLGDNYDKIRGTKGGFDSFIRTLSRFKKELPKIPFSATFVLTPFNTDQLLPCFEFCEKEGLDFFAQFGVSKQARSPGVFKWEEQDYIKIKSYTTQIIERIIAKFSDIKSFGSSLITVSDKINLLTKIYYWAHLVDFQRSKGRFSYNCGSGFKYAMFDPYGNLFFCPLLKDKAIGNIRKHGFDELWSSEAADRARAFININKCSCWLVCTVFPVVGRALALYGDNAAESLIKNNNNQALVPRAQNLTSSRASAGNIESTCDKEQDLELNNKEFREKKVILQSNPQHVTIGTNYRCNASCMFCLEGEYKPFSLELYKNYFEPKLNKMINQAKTISFCGMGELLLIPEIKNFLEHINKTLPEKNKILTTNGLALKADISGVFLESKYSIQISLHASNPGLHEQLTGLKDGFDKIIKQVSNIISKRRNTESPYVSLIFLVNTMNIEDLPDFLELAASLGVDCVQCNYLTIFRPAHLKLSCFFKQETTNEMFDKAIKRAEELKIILNLPPKFSANNYFKTSCSGPWKHIYVDTEGAVLPCCYSGEHFGELREADIFSIWNNSKYQQLRMDLASGGGALMCRHCLNNNPKNVNLLDSHISFRPEVKELIAGQVK